MISTVADELANSRLDIVRTVLQRGLVEGESDGVRPYFSQGSVVRVPPLRALPKGAWAWIALGRFLSRGLSGVHIELVDWFAADDSIVTRLSVEAVHSGPLGRLAPTGRKIHVTVLACWRFGGAVIREVSAELSSWDVMRQLDVLELAPPPSPQEV